MTTGPCVEVLRAGALTTVQDLGRRGYAHLGVPRSGALDPDAHALANRLVGNPEASPVLETTGDGVALRFAAPCLAAVTGAAAAVRLDGVPVRWGAPVYVPGGSVLDVGVALLGLRCYVAVAGSFRLPSTLGSVSTDLLSGLGPPPLAAGQLVRLGPGGRPAPGAELATLRLPGNEIVVPLYPGPRRDRLGEQGARLLFAQSYEVSAQSNRIGLRLLAAPIECHRSGELPSEGLVWGSVQLTNDGQLVLLLADHPTTGGYPVIAVADRSAASACAQVRPGATVRFGRAHLPGFAGW
jgi:biotin-dependent carboxylase-like uncharacterized protein